MGVFNLVTLALFVVGSLAGRIQENHNQGVKKKDDKHLLSRLQPKKWAILVAGSEGWDNYRHQDGNPVIAPEKKKNIMTDICHAYQILVQNGIPKDNIITMAMNDIAHHPKNPTPGKLVSRPNGTNVYTGVSFDYQGTDVTSKNFLNIITGNETAMRSIGSGKVYKGGPFDTVFINFVDHGAKGMLCFPNDELYADELNNALKTMRSKRSYGKMLLYIEACNSGSLFDGILPDDINVLAVTAAGPRESSFSLYCLPSENMPYGTCLTDFFSAMWMEKVEETVSDAVGRKQSIFNHFSRVRADVIASNVMMYGDFNIGREKVSTFMGNRPRGDNSANNFVPQLVKRKKTESCGNSRRDTARHHLMNDNLTNLQRQKLEEEISERDKMRNTIDTVLRSIYAKIVELRPDIVEETGTIDDPNDLELSLDMFPCYRSIVTDISEKCFSVPKNPYLMNKLTFFADLCVVDQSMYNEVNQIIDEVCLNIPKGIQYVH